VESSWKARHRNQVFPHADLKVFPGRRPGVREQRPPRSKPIKGPPAQSIPPNCASAICATARAPRPARGSHRRHRDRLKQSVRDDVSTESRNSSRVCRKRKPDARLGRPGTTPGSESGRGLESASFRGVLSPGTFLRVRRKPQPRPGQETLAAAGRGRLIFRRLGRFLRNLGALGAFGGAASGGSGEALRIVIDPCSLFSTRCSHVPTVPVTLPWLSLLLVLTPQNRIALRAPVRERHP